MRLFFIFLVLSLIAPVIAQSTDCPENFEGYLAPRLANGQQARVLPDVVLNVRPQPNTNFARIGRITSGARLDILSEPACAEGFVWWFADVEGVRGWVVEGNFSSGEYYLEPRGEMIEVIQDDGTIERYVRTDSGFLEPEGCMLPPDDYDRVQLGYAIVNARTVFMLEQAQRNYNESGGTRANFKQLLTQGSYNPGGVSASFGTHDGGGAVDISVRDYTDFSVMEDEIAPMIKALRIAGFAAWLRAEDELYEGSVIHIHAIAIGDAEASSIAQEQVNSLFGYFAGYNGIPPEDNELPYPDIYGEPIICEWMVDMGFEDMRDIRSQETGL